MAKIIIGCGSLTKEQINVKIANETRGKINIDLRIINYKYNDLEGILLPNILVKFGCSYNKITSFIGLELPNSLIEFDCSYNKITSFAGLKLPNSLIEFDCFRNKITSFAGLTLPNSLTKLYCSYNQVEVVRDFEFSPSLQSLFLDTNTKFINPKFNSVIGCGLSSYVTYNNLDIQQLLFIYLNFKSLSYQQYDEILNNLVMST
jgi:hypothetical protein